MFIKLPTLIAKYGMYNDKAIKGIIHVGAHTAEEDDDYKICSVPKVAWVEPCKPAFEVIKEKFSEDPTVKLINCAFGDVAADDVPMFVENVNKGTSNSIMRPKVHLQEYPSIQFTDREMIKIRMMDQFVWLRDGSYNFLNMDTQGYELKVLQGGVQTLAAIDYIYTEVNRAEIYEGCAQLNQLDAFLAMHGFERKEVYWCHGGVSGTWGDAFYVKKK